MLNPYVYRWNHLFLSFDVRFWPPVFGGRKKSLGQGTANSMGSSGSTSYGVPVVAIPHPSHGWPWLTIWLWLTVRHGKIHPAPMLLRTVNHLFRLGPFSMAMLVITRGYRFLQPMLLLGCPHKGKTKKQYGAWMGKSEKNIKKKSGIFKCRADDTKIGA